MGITGDTEPPKYTIFVSIVLKRGRERTGEGHVYGKRRRRKDEG